MQVMFKNPLEVLIMIDVFLHLPDIKQVQGGAVSFWYNESIKKSRRLLRRSRYEGRERRSLPSPKRLCAGRSPSRRRERSVVLFTGTCAMSAGDSAS